MTRLPAAVSRRQVNKERSMLLQKQMIAGPLHRARARSARRPQSGLHLCSRQSYRTAALVQSAAGPCQRSTRCNPACASCPANISRKRKSIGHSEDVCTYVKCDIGMLKKGNIGPTGERLPDPDLLLLSYTGCFTFMKWFELLRQEYDCPVAMLHVPYQAEGRIHAASCRVHRPATAHRGHSQARSE